MGKECRDCRKWEEYMYWTHFQSILFCQVLPPGFDRQLAIPKKFSKNLKEKIQENVTLKGPSGAKWNVGLITRGDTLLFKQGWKAFVEDHSLEEDDLLIFKYNGDSRFDVLIFDGRSLCEREASYFVRKCGHTELHGGCQTKRNMRESPEEVGHDSSHDAVGCTPSKRLRKDVNLMPVQSGQDNRANARVCKGAYHSRPHHSKWNMRSREPSTCGVAQKVNSELKKAPVGAYPVQYISNRRPVTEAEKEKALQLAHAASTKDSFTVVMRASHVYKGFYMSIPSEWATSHLPRKHQKMVLRIKGNTTVKENTWHARFYYRVYGGGLSGGWRNFAVENNLEEFDVCLFDLASGISDAIVMDVSIFRVVEDVSPLTRVISPSSSCGQRSKYPRRK